MLSQLKKIKIKNAEWRQTTTSNGTIGVTAISDSLKLAVTKTELGYELVLAATSLDDDILLSALYIPKVEDVVTIVNSYLKAVGQNKLLELE